MSIFSELWGIIDPGGDPQAINQAATACGELAEALRHVATSLDSESASLATSWKGIPGPNGEDDSGSAKYQEAWRKFSAAIVEYADGLDEKKDGAEAKLKNVAAEIQNAQDQARHLVGVAETSVLVGVGLSVVTFGISDAFADAGAVAMVAADAETLAETLGLVLRAAMIAIRGLGQALLNIATRFVIGAGFAVLSEAFAKAVHGENPFNLDNWDANDIGSLIVLGMVSAGVGALASDTTGFTRVAEWIKANPVKGNTAYFLANGFGGAAASEYLADGEKFNMSSVLGVVESTALSAVGGALYGKYIVGGRIGMALGLGQAPDAADMPGDPTVAVPDPPAPDVSVADALSGGADNGTAGTAGRAVTRVDPVSVTDGAGAEPAPHAAPDGAGGPPSDGVAVQDGAAAPAGPGSGADGATGPAGHAAPNGAGAPPSDGVAVQEGAAAPAGPGSGADGAAGPVGHVGPDSTAAQATDGAGTGADRAAGPGTHAAQNGADAQATEGAAAPAGPGSGADRAAGPGAHAAQDGADAQATDGAGTGAGEQAVTAKFLTKAGEVTGVKKSNLMRSTVRSPASSIAHALSFEAPPPVPPVPLAPPPLPSSVADVPPPSRQPPASRLGQPAPRPGHPVSPPGQPAPRPGQPAPPPGQPAPPPGQPVPPGGHVGGGTFTVRPGDTLWEIARERLGNPLLFPLIEQANPQVGPNALIFPGEELNVPVVPAAPAGSNVVVVQPGDTLWGITGGNEELIGEIARINHIDDPSLIFVGQTLIVPPA